MRILCSKGQIHAIITFVQFDYEILVLEPKKGNFYICVGIKN